MILKNINALLSVDYQRSLWDDYQYIRWNQIGVGFELNYSQYIFLRFGYNINLDEKDNNENREGFTYGLAFEIPVDLKILSPFRICLSASKGVTDLQEITDYIFSISLKFNIWKN